MKKILQGFYIIYQYIFFLPVWGSITVFTAITTMIFMHWRNSEWLHHIQQFWSRCFFWLLFMDVKVDGIENITPRTSYVFVCNHQSMSDVFAVYGWLPVIFKWIMKKELRKVPFIGSACAAAGHIYIDRGRKKSAFNTMKNAEKVLHDGVCVVIFPEGTRTPDGSVQRFKRGAFAIAQDLNLPIVPISLTGCFEVMPKGVFYARHHAVSMHIGKPFDYAAVSEDDQPAAIEQIRQAVIDGMGGDLAVQ